VENHRVLNLDPKDPLWVGMKKPSDDHPTGVTHRDTLKMDWTHGHNHTIHNGISRIGYYTGGHAARFRDEDLPDKWVEKSKEWIGKNKKDPFFLFFASHDLHVPRIPHERFRGKSGMSYRGDVIVQLDWCVGEIVKYLEKEGLEKDTMIVFCSDNGPVGDDGYADEALEEMGDHRAAGPYSGGKYSIFEGGTRTPFITYWPGTIKPGVSDKVVCTIDLAGSLANHLGVKLPKDACLDSLDVMDSMLGKKKAQGRPHLIQQDNGRGNNYGYRVGNWKLQRHDSKKTNNYQVNKLLGGQRGQKVPQFALFDLSKDPAEKNDLSAEYPKIFSKMKTELQKFLDDGRSR
jgi:arylsulfatase A